MVTELKPNSKVNVIEKTENGDLPSESRTAAHPRLDEKYPIELLMGKTVRIINNAMAPTNKTSTPVKFNRRAALNEGNSDFALDSRTSHFWTPGNVVRGQGEVNYEIQVDEKILIQYRTQSRLTGTEVARSSAPLLSTTGCLLLLVGEKNEYLEKNPT
ncbi:hypothetical protein ACTXT7_015488 [Hymenolepis weldensis]